METQPAVFKPEKPSERVNAVAMALFAILTLALATPGAFSDAKSAAWGGLFAAVLGMSATCEGIPFARWRGGAALMAGGVVLVAIAVKLFSYELSTIIYKLIAYFVLLAGFVSIVFGLRRYFAEPPAIFLVTAGMIVMVIAAAGAAVLAIGMKVVANDLAVYVLAVCCVVFGTLVAVMAMLYQNWADANARPAEERWSAPAGAGGA
jgi:hypothetical protein